MTEKIKISVIIPCLNEEANLKELIPLLQLENKEVPIEIILSDGGSLDNSVAIAESLGAIVVKSPICNRAYQMNMGAKNAKGTILYFVHADTRPVRGFTKVILANFSEGKQVGCFRYKFDGESRLLRLNSWFTRFNGVFAGGGDQSLFISKEHFFSLGGYNENFVVMEDFDLVRTIRQKSDFHVVPHDIIVSNRKYRENSWLRVQAANSIAFCLFLLKVKPASIKSLYLNLLK